MSERARRARARRWSTTNDHRDRAAPNHPPPLPALFACLDMTLAHRETAAAERLLERGARETLLAGSASVAPTTPPRPDPAGADTTIEGRIHHGTARDWADYLGRDAALQALDGR
jgi:hypothetical protein